MDYKDTLQMPKTDFEMRGNLAKKEPGIQQKWQDIHLYEQMKEQRKDAKPFVLHDGPPYANGDIHLGHALNKILKDVINRAKYMDGYRIEYIPGWDTHGLPIETAVTKAGYDRKKMGIAEFRKVCHEYALEQVEKQKKGFLAVGSIGDYDHPYITLQKEFEAKQIDIFGKMAIDGLIYKGLKPVYWSPSSETALAEAEVEYKDMKTPTIFVKFKVRDGKGILDDDTYFVIWTTTPWTVPANQAISLNPRMSYALVQTDKGKLVMLEELVNQLCPEFGCETFEIVKTFKGSELEYITYDHPLYANDPSHVNAQGIVAMADYVTADAGTGCVHTASAFGADDFYTVHTRYKMDVLNNVDDQGRLTAEASDWLEGQYVFDANKTVTIRLDETGNLLKMSWLTHAYPHDWRTKKPIIYRATTQWFASIDKIRDELLEQIDEINWTPSWGQQRMHNMIADRDDWCISRQRAWGVPIPIIYGEDDTPLMEQEIFDHVSALFREYGSNVWFERDAKDLLPEGYTSEHSPNGIFRKETDTMDVWFDSGSSHTGVLLERGLEYPSDLYFEGSDQYRGWFNSSLIIGTAIHGRSPYKNCLSHGFVMDEKGVKMSKSQWNAVAPGEITKKQGADVLRLWACSVDYQADASMGQKILKQMSNDYRKVRNTLRFLMANLDHQTFTKEDCLLFNELAPLNKYILVRLQEIIPTVKRAYDQYRFADAVSTMSNFMTNDLSAYYMDYTKDILYCDGVNSRARREVQTVLYTACEVLTKLWAPILCHTTEEVNNFMKFNETSIHLESFPELTLDFETEALVNDMNVVLELRKSILKALEEAREAQMIGKSLEAEVILNVDDQVKDALGRIVDNPAQWLIVSKVSFANEGPQVTVQKAKGHVCPRCWTYTESEHEDGLCDRCAEVLNKE